MANPRLLLFGPPGAGKSSLLGALAQAASTQGAMLKGELVGASAELDELRKSTYQAKPAATSDLTAYDIRLQPNEGAPLTATLLDSGGASAQAMLRTKRPFADAHPMQAQILDADGVLLLLDASLTGKQLGEEFQQFARWLKDLHEVRGRLTEVGDLPVYVVLTKCDMLVKPNDTSAMWVQRIEDAKRRVDQKLREHLKEMGSGFGSIQLNVWATAIKRPALTDRPAKAQEPYGVAELFRQCLHSAREYDLRQVVSQGRLHNVVAGMIGAVTLLALVLGFLVQFQPEAKNDSLDQALEAVLPRDDVAAADRLRGTTNVLEEKLRKIAAIEADPAFERGSAKTKEALHNHKEEVALYLEYYRREKATLKLPYKAKNEEEYRELEKKVQAFPLPEDKAEAWKETPLGKHLQLLREAYKTMSAEVDLELAWTREQIKKNKALAREGRPLIDKLESEIKEKRQLARQEAEAWKTSYQKHLAESPRTRLRDAEFTPEVRARYKSLAQFKRVQDVRKEWEKSKNELNATAESIQSRL